MEIGQWRKSGSGMGPSKIDLQDIEHYCRFSDVMVNWNVVRLIRAMDDEYLSQYAKNQSSS